MDLRVVLDTNAIYSASGGHLLAYEIKQLILETQGDEHLRVSWYLPQTVLDERRYQLKQEAITLRSQVAKFEKVIRHRFELTDAQIEEWLAVSVSEQVKECGLLICPMNPSLVDWLTLISSAVARTPPFDPKPEGEKGFRDALILEGLKQLVASAAGEESIRFAFVTRDGLLAEATRAAGLLRVDVFESIDEVRTLINVLLSTKVTEAIVAAWQAKAKEYFFNHETRKGVFSDLGVASRIKEDCRAELAALPADADYRENEWKWLVAPGPTFIRKVRERVWWASRVKIRSQAFSSAAESLIHTDFAEVDLDLNVSDNWLPSGEASTMVPMSTSSIVLPAGEPFNLISPSSRSFISSPLIGAGWPTVNYLIQPSTSAGMFLPRRKLVARGLTTIVLSWSVEVDAQGDFSEPKIESVEAAGTEWDGG
jgi:hypothetical protein